MTPAGTNYLDVLADQHVTPTGGAEVTELHGRPSYLTTSVLK